MGTGEFNARGNSQWTIATISHPEGVGILLVTSYNRNRDKLWPDGPLGSYSDFTSNISVTINSKYCSEDHTLG